MFLARGMALRCPQSAAIRFKIISQRGGAALFPLLVKRATSWKNQKITPAGLLRLSGLSPGISFHASLCGGSRSGMRLGYTCL